MHTVTRVSALLVGACLLAAVWLASNLVASHTLEASLSVLTLDAQFVICRSVDVVSDDG